ncbi:MAG TPA: hypothetical protein VK604_25650 [Bryobacteraceae bacterium]|nr:hypothetical protein [Bryobacteraceae bacterium]
MRSVLALGLLISLCAAADAAPAHRSKPPRSHMRPDPRPAAPSSYAVPGWTEEQTRSWLDGASGPKG